jgi:hypothetical protein
VVFALVVLVVVAVVVVVVVEPAETSLPKPACRNS